MKSLVRLLPRSVPIVALLGLWGAHSGCGMQPQDLRPDAMDKTPLLLAEGENLHVISAWTDSVALVGEGEKVPAPSGKEAWRALYRIPIKKGAEKETLAQEAYGVLVRKERSQLAPLLVYLVPQTDGPQTLRSLGRVFVVSPEGPTKEITPANPAHVLQPALLSPDNRYLLTYGKSSDPLFWSLDLTDLQTGVSQRLGLALSITPPNWLGFDGPGKRYVSFQNVEDYRPVAIYELPQGMGRIGPPLVLPGRVVGILPDGRAVTEGTDLRAVVLEANGAQSVLAKAPVQGFSAFVRGENLYYIAAAMGATGVFYRVTPKGEAEEVVSAASYTWYVPSGGTRAYLAETPGDQGLNLIAVQLPKGPALSLSLDPVAGYKPTLGDGILFFRSGAPGASYYAPGILRPLSLSKMASSVWQLSETRFALLERVDKGQGVLSLVEIDPAAGQVAAPMPFAEGVDLVDGSPKRMIYSIPKGDKAGVYWHVF